nr:hypothetical protein [Tanacetum cinerariifolium]
MDPYGNYTSGALKPKLPASVWGRVIEVVGEMGEWWRGSKSGEEWLQVSGGKKGSSEQWPKLHASVWGRVIEVVGDMGEWWRGSRRGEE